MVPQLGMIAIVASIALVSAAQAQESVGRYQAITVPRGGGDGALVLVDTATGRTWILGGAAGAGGKAEQRWQPLRFLTPEAGAAQATDPLYPNATGPDDPARRSGASAVPRPKN